MVSFAAKPENPTQPRPSTSEPPKAATSGEWLGGGPVELVSWLVSSFLG